MSTISNAYATLSFVNCSSWLNIDIRTLHEIRQVAPNFPRLAQ